MGEILNLVNFMHKRKTGIQRYQIKLQIKKQLCLRNFIPYFD